MRDLTGEEIENVDFPIKDGETAKNFLYSLIAEDGPEMLEQQVAANACLCGWKTHTIETIKNMVRRMAY
mgnify:CR=1 FL=1